MFQRICRLFLLLVLLWPGASWGAIAIDVTSEGGGTTSPITVSHTVSGSDRYLICHAFLYKTGANETVSTWTWNGSENLTQIATTFNGDVRVEFWGLKNPTTGNHNWVMTASANTDLVAGCASYTGVNQTTPLGTAVTGGDASTAPSVTVSSASGELVVDALAVNSPSGSGYSLGAGQTERWSHSISGGNFNAPEAVSSTEAGAGSVTMSYTLNNAWNWALAAVPLLPASGGGGGAVSRAMLIGVGP